MCSTHERGDPGQYCLDSALLEPLSNREYIARMLRNLKGIYLAKSGSPAGPRHDRPAGNPPPRVGPERRDRGLVHYQLGEHQQSLDDLVFYKDSTPLSDDAEDVQRLVNRLKGPWGPNTVRVCLQPTRIPAAALRPVGIIDATLGHHHHVFTARAQGSAQHAFRFSPSIPRRSVETVDPQVYGAIDGGGDVRLGDIAVTPSPSPNTEAKDRHRHFCWSEFTVFH